MPQWATLTVLHCWLGGVSLPLERITLLFQQLHREPLCGGSLCHIPLGRNQRRNSSTKHGRGYYFQGFHMYGMYIWDEEKNKSPTGFS